MTQPYKVCPQCGQPAVLTMPLCGRCGFQYAPPAQAMPARSGTPGIPMERSSARRAAHIRGAAVTAITALALVSAVVLAAILPGMQRPHGSVKVTDAPVTAASQSRDAFTKAPPTGSSLLGSGANGGGGMFVERASRQITPTVIVQTSESDRITLTLTAKDGTQYTAIAGPGADGRLQVPAGNYLVSVSSDQPGIHSNYGSAVFRQRREYLASFTYSTYAPPLELGDRADGP